jgi:hypothetical protein
MLTSVMDDDCVIYVTQTECRVKSKETETGVVLAAQKDPDWEEWWNTDSDRALMRLIRRFPHWICCEGGGLI